MISKISERVKSQGFDDEKAFIRTVLIIAKEYHYTLDYILYGMKIPQYMAIVEHIKEMKQNGKK